MKPLIVANWKCNPATLNEAKKLLGLVKKGIKKTKKAEVVICPPFTQFSIFLDAKRTPRRVAFQFSKNLKLGGQNCFWEKKGAFTGEVSPAMLKNLGCDYVIIGHSERRRYFREDNEMINRKIRAALSEKLKPIFCIGENQEEKEKEETQEVLKLQIEKGLKSISKKEIKNIIIAYEPVWAIGTGNPCDPEEAQKMALVIRKIIAGIYSFSISKNVRILYGGSVNSKNSGPYVKEAGFEGLLVGGASLDAQEFVKILKSVI